MTRPVATNPCDRQKLELFLADQLSAREQSTCETHLTQCAACRQQLEQLAAQPEFWNAAVSALTPDPQDDPETDYWPTPGTSSSASAIAEPAFVQATAGENSQRAMRDVIDRGNARPRGRRFSADLDGPDGFDWLTNPQRFLAPTDDPQMLGRLGPYEIAGIIGSGGMGVVLKGFDRSLNRYVAIKILSPVLAASGAARKRFAREAQAAAAVVHPNVVEIHGVAEARGLPYLVMTYLRGESLQKRLDLHGPLELNEILRIGLQVAEGLAAAHAQGLVHRDIKPGNLLLADGVERVKITDFGLARAVDDASLTRTGVIAGTPQFMSPEQARGEVVDHRSDLFSLGSVMYAMCTGRPPFRAETTLAVLHRVLNSEPRPIRDLNPRIPRWLVALVARLMSKSADDRIENASEVAALLQQALAHCQQPDQVPLPALLVDAERTGRLDWRHQLRRLLTAWPRQAGVWLASFGRRSTATNDGRSSLRSARWKQAVAIGALVCGCVAGLWSLGGAPTTFRLGDAGSFASRFMQAGTYDHQQSASDGASVKARSGPSAGMFSAVPPVGSLMSGPIGVEIASPQAETDFVPLEPSLPATPANRDGSASWEWNQLAVELGIFTDELEQLNRELDDQLADPAEVASELPLIPAAPPADQTPIPQPGKSAPLLDQELESPSLQRELTLPSSEVAPSEELSDQPNITTEPTGR